MPAASDRNVVPGRSHNASTLGDGLFEPGGGSMTVRGISGQVAHPGTGVAVAASAEQDRLPSRLSRSCVLSSPIWEESVLLHPC